MKKRLVVLLVIAALLGLAVSAHGATVSAWGRQYRGSVLNPPQLEGNVFTLPSPGTIIQASSSGPGFWIVSAATGAKVAQFWEASAAVGQVLAAGSYRVYPNLGQAQNSARVNVVFNVGGGGAGLVWVRNTRWNFSIQLPANWNGNLDTSNETALQAIDPTENAFLEVHASRGGGNSLEWLANELEAELGYSLNRVSQNTITLSGGQTALLREYTGYYNGTPIGAGILYTHHQGVYYVVIGIYTQSTAGQFANLLGQCMGSITFGNQPQPHSHPEGHHHEEGQYPYGYGGVGE